MADRKIIIASLKGVSADEAEFEMCEHKGIGHPDSIMDGVCEAVSRDLSLAYLKQYGRILHHNVDKGLLVAGRSRPRFGGGEIREKIKIRICGRVTEVAGGKGATEIAVGAARRYLENHVHCDIADFEIIPEFHEGSANLKEVFTARAGAPRANDTSFGCGYAPFSRLESTVLELSSLLKSESFRKKFPAAGDDFKIMGQRAGEDFRFTLAIALIDRYVENAGHYFEIKRAVHDHLTREMASPAVLRINTLDDEGAQNEGGLYLTVTGLSAEMGDDGQVGRGNRVNGLITPGRPMSLEACAGKNPTNHVGKIYNVLAHLMAQDLIRKEPSLKEIHVSLLSEIGAPIDDPKAVFLQIRATKAAQALEESLAGVVRDWLGDLRNVTERILKEQVSVF